MIFSRNFLDAAGNPDGGQTFGEGFAIAWQRGPLSRDSGRARQNGAFVADVIEAARSRLLFFQSSKFACDENALAIDHLNMALAPLKSCIKQREHRGVEGAREV